MTDAELIARLNRWIEQQVLVLVDSDLLPIRDRIEDLEAKLAQAVEALRNLHGAVCGETGFAAAVRAVSGKAYPWPQLDQSDADARAILAEIKGECHD